MGLFQHGLLSPLLNSHHKEPFSKRFWRSARERRVRRSRGGMFFSTFAHDKSIERQARYVSAVVGAARKSDQRKLKAIAAERSYLAEMDMRIASMAPSATYETTEHGPWVPEDLASLLAWIRRISVELSECDPCAPAIPSGKTDAELALELASPMRLCQLTYSTEPGGSPQAARLVPVLQRLLDEFERRRLDVDGQLQQLPLLLHKLAAHGGPALKHAAQLPPALAVALLALPNAAPPGGGGGGSGGGGSGGGSGGNAAAAAAKVFSSTKDELAHGGAIGGKVYRENARRLLKMLSAHQPHELTWLVHHPPRLRAEEMSRTSPRLRAAVVAATTAAAALCQAVRWAEASAAAVAKAAPAQVHEEAAAGGDSDHSSGACLAAADGASDGAAAGSGGRPFALGLAVRSKVMPLIPSLGLAAAGVGVQRYSHVKETVQEKIRRENAEAQAKAAKKFAIVHPENRLGAVHDKWLSELSNYELWGGGGGGGMGMGGIVPTPADGAEIAEKPTLSSIAAPAVDDRMGLADCDALVGLIARRLHPEAIHALSFHGHKAGEAAKVERAAAAATESAAAKAAAAGAAVADTSDVTAAALGIHRPSGYMEMGDAAVGTDGEAPAPSGGEDDTVGYLPDDAPVDEATLGMLRLALLASCQLLVALLAQALAVLLCEHMHSGGSGRLPLTAEEANALMYAASPEVTPIACVAALLRLAGPLRRCALQATDGTARSLAARCDWSAQLALLAEPTTDLSLSLAIASIGAALNVTVANRQRMPADALAVRVKTAVLAATRATRPLPNARPRLLPIASPNFETPASAAIGNPPTSPSGRERRGFAPAATLTTDPFTPGVAASAAASAIEKAATPAATASTTSCIQPSFSPSASTQSLVPPATQPLSPPPRSFPPYTPPVYGSDWHQGLLPTTAGVTTAGATTAAGEAPPRPPTLGASHDGRGYRTKSKSDLRSGIVPGGGFLESLPAGSPNRYGRGRDEAIAKSGRVCGGQRPSTAGSEGRSLSPPVGGRPQSAAALSPTVGGVGNSPAGWRFGSSSDLHWQVGSSTDWMALAGGDWSALTNVGGSKGGFHDPMSRPRSAIAAASALGGGHVGGGAARRGVKSAGLARPASVASFSAQLDREAASQARRSGRPVGGSYTAVRTLHRAASAATSVNFSLMGETVPLYAAEQEAAAVRAHESSFDPNMGLPPGSDPLNPHIGPFGAPPAHAAPHLAPSKTTPIVPMTLSLDLRHDLPHNRALGGSRGPGGLPSSRPSSGRRPGSAASRPMSANKRSGDAADIIGTSVPGVPVGSRPMSAARPNSAATRPGSGRPGGQRPGSGRPGSAARSHEPMMDPSCMGIIEAGPVEHLDPWMPPAATAAAEIAAMAGRAA